MTYRSSLSVLMAAALCACAPNRPDLAPAAGAQMAPPGPGAGGVASDAGITIEARAGAWRGTPQNLEAESIPMLVEITNDSDRGLRIRYNELQLVAPDGRTFHAIPPYNVEGEVSQAVDVPAFNATRFLIAPYLSRYYPVYDAWTGTFVYDPLYYQTYVPASVQVELPSADMISMALPEGVLEAGGSITGFVYFEDVEDLSIPSVDFTASLVDAETGTPFGTVRVPFTVQ